jgi:serine/threonine-protein kinase
VEKAILWAMSLHPDDRPKNVIEFREALVGHQEIPDRADLQRSNFDMPAFTIFPQEQIAGYAALGLFLTGLIATLVK